MKALWAFIISQRFWKHVAAAVVLTFLLITLVSVWLKGYTNHKQKLELPSYVDMHLSNAKSTASKQTFNIVVSDSVHIVGEPGGMILNQNPVAGSKVKEGRKIYVTVTKNNPDLVHFSSLPVLYGKNYERKKRELEMGYKINSKIIGEKYDPGPAGHILEVVYKGDTVVTRRSRVKDLSIPKGDVLGFIISKNSGGNVQVPKLVCETYSTAKFILNSYKLSLGGADADGTVTDFENAYVWKQEPEYLDNKRIPMGSEIKLFLTQAQPPQCGVQSDN